MRVVGDLLWILILFLIGLFLYNPITKELFLGATSAHPVVMGFVKFFILATMGELLAIRLSTREWKVKGIGLEQRALVWGLLGVLLTFVFPIYSFGVDGLVSAGLLWIPDSNFSFVVVAFWKSFFMNMLFAFPMMSLHRITDTLIDQKALFRSWPFLKVWKEINWENMWKKVGPTIIWFWIPAHTVTFCLPPHYRILMASALGICLGLILVFIKKRAN